MLRCGVLPVIVCRTLFAALATGCLLHGALAADQAPRVMAHYMPWFGMETLPDGTIHWEHWCWQGNGPKHDANTMLANGRRDIASVYYPLIGPYDGRDPAVLEYHFLTAKACGIEGFIADWYGGGFTDTVFSEMVSAAERYGMTVAICLEEKTFFPGYTNITTRAGAVAEARRQVRLVLNTHARSPAYWRIGGQAVFLIFPGHREDELGQHVLTPEELAEVLGSVDPPGIHFIRSNANEAYNGLVQGGYAWIDGTDYRDWFYPTAAHLRESGQWETAIGAANPGFDDTGVWGWGNGVRIVERRDGDEYAENWDYILRYNPDVVQVATWNDFEEGTTIEPAEGYGFDYIDATERFVGRWLGRKVREHDNPWPVRLYAARKTLRSVPDSPEKQKLAGRMDRWALAFSQGRRWWMEWRLKRIARDASALADQSNR